MGGSEKFTHQTSTNFSTEHLVHSRYKWFWQTSGVIKDSRVITELYHLPREKKMNLFDSRMPFQWSIEIWEKIRTPAQQKRRGKDVAKNATFTVQENINISENIRFSPCQNDKWFQDSTKERSWRWWHWHHQRTTAISLGHISSACYEGEDSKYRTEDTTLEHISTEERSGNRLDRLENSNWSMCAPSLRENLICLTVWYPSRSSNMCRTLEREP